MISARKRLVYSVVNTLIAFIWLTNGLFCKLLNMVPRHQQIVARILGDNHSRLFTVLIGIAEIIMSAFILSKWRARWNAITQIIVIATMNTIEFFLAPDLLLWGKWNAFFAFILIIIICLNEFVLNKEINN